MLETKVSQKPVNVTVTFTLGKKFEQGDDLLWYLEITDVVLLPMPTI